jgi:dipeptidyl aminopeptidase/acylaminoacyl peptidase
LSSHINEADLVDSQVIRYRSFDGLEIPAILYRPKGATKSSPAPALVWVHGGPGGQSRTGYSPDVQFFVNHGYAVIAPNNRGSVGYGKTFFHLDDRKHGEGDLQDVVYAKRYLAGLDWVDSQRVGVIGGSYGGYMVCAALAFEPDTFAVGIDFFGVVNWVRAIQNMPVWWGAARQYWLDEMGDPAKDPEQLQNRSPLLHAKNIRVPLLVIQGAHDPRVLPADSEEIVAAVKANGVPAELVVYQDEGHGFRKRDNRIDALERYDRFLDQYLLAPR